MIDHSQNKEATIIRKYFKKRKGTLLDIGAYDGISLSNSYDLISAGWKGIMFEPDKRSFDCLEILYRGNENVQIFNKGIAKQTGEHKFFVDSMLSTLYEDQKREGEIYKEDTASFICWEDFYSGQQFNFVTIDAEGADVEILHQMDLKKMGVECLCIEHNGDAGAFDCIINYCSRFNLKEISLNSENIILTL